MAKPKPEKDKFASDDTNVIVLPPKKPPRKVKG